MKQLILNQAVQESDYSYMGFTSFHDLAGVVKEYPFHEEVMEKAEIHKINMQRQAGDCFSVPAFSVTLRLEPDSMVQQTGDQILFSIRDYDIRDGKSKAAVLTLLEPEWLAQAQNIVKVHIFILSEDKMAVLQS